MRAAAWRLVYPKHTSAVTSCSRGVSVSPIEIEGITYHSPHKFRHGHIQYGLAHSESIADYKAVSMNVMYSSMEITDQFYSNLNDGEIQSRISGLKKKDQPSDNGELEQFRQFLEWRKRNLS
jgi:hypothetical protein